MAVNIVHASCDENGKAHGGLAGDQTGKEVCIRSWYNGNWNVVLRARDRNVAAKMVKFCTDCAKSNMVGYDQMERNSLRAAAKNANYDGSNLKVKCETDCSAFMTVAAEAAGINMDNAYTNIGNGVMNAPVTQNMRTKFSNTGAFIVLTASKYLTSSNYLLSGDILVRESGHTAMVVDDGAYAHSEESSPAISYNIETISGTYKVNTKTDPLNCRNNFTTSSTVIGKFQKGEIVTATQKYEKWLYVTNGIITGWASADYLVPYTPTQPVVETPPIVINTKPTLEDFIQLMREFRYTLQDNDCSPYSENARKWAVEYGLINGGSGDNFNGMWEDFLTREQFVTVLYRYYSIINGYITSINNDINKITTEVNKLANKL